MRTVCCGVHDCMLCSIGANALDRQRLLVHCLSTLEIQGNWIRIENAICADCFLGNEQCIAPCALQQVDEESDRMIPLRRGMSNARQRGTMIIKIKCQGTFIWYRIRE